MRTIAAVAAGALAAVVMAHAGSSATAGSSQPYGKWQARLTKAALLDYGFVDPRAPGVWRLELRRNGTYRAYNPLDGWVSGRLGVSGNRLAVWATPACGGLVGTTTGRAHYRWALTNDRLRLTSATPDPCGGRWQTLTIPVWSRQSEGG